MRTSALRMNHSESAERLYRTEPKRIKQSQLPQKNEDIDKIVGDTKDGVLNSLIDGCQRAFRFALLCSLYSFSTSVDSLLGISKSSQKEALGWVYHKVVAFADPLIAQGVKDTANKADEVATKASEKLREKKELKPKKKTIWMLLGW